eukprot:4399496-Amphidinium_carterae.1
MARPPGQTRDTGFWGEHVGENIVLDATWTMAHCDQEVEGEHLLPENLGAAVEAVWCCRMSIKPPALVQQKLSGLQGQGTAAVGIGGTSVWLRG